MSRLARVVASVSFSAVAFAAAPASAAAEDAVDMTSVRDKMSLVTDGKGHYMAYAPLEQMSELLFYGDGKDFYQQRVFGGGSEGDIAFSRNFWEPRAVNSRGATFDFRNKKSRSTAATASPR